MSLALVHTEAVRGIKVPSRDQYRPYDSDLDPLHKPAPEPSEPTAVYYYHTDHLGTPQALTDEQMESGSWKVTHACCC